MTIINFTVWDVASLWVGANSASSYLVYMGFAAAALHRQRKNRGLVTYSGTSRRRGSEGHALVNI